VSRLRVLFMGTPDFAVPSLQTLLDGPDEVVGVVTQPDRPAGRQRRLTPPPVKRLAEARGLPVFQPARLLDEGVFEALAATAPDIGVVVAFGKILRPRFLTLPRLGCLNVHASLLPRWRGAAPINWAIASGDPETGVCLQQMDPGLDTGPVLKAWRTAIGPIETAGELHDRLASAGAALLAEVLGELRAGRPVAATPQDDSLATYARMLTKEDGVVDFARPATDVAAHIRGMTPWPGAFCTTPRGPLKLLRAVAVDPASVGATAGWRPGEILAADVERGLVIGTGAGGAVAILECQRPGRHAMAAIDHLCGLHEHLVGERWRAPAELP
jgi:methionyl-tRNA formyltransferase